MRLLIFIEYAKKCNLLCLVTYFEIPSTKDHQREQTVKKRLYCDVKRFIPVTQTIRTNYNTVWSITCLGGTRIAVLGQRHFRKFFIFDIINDVEQRCIVLPHGASRMTTITLDKMLCLAYRTGTLSFIVQEKSTTST